MTCPQAGHVGGGATNGGGGGAPWRARRPGTSAVAPGTAGGDVRAWLIDSWAQRPHETNGAGVESGGLSDLLLGFISPSPLSKRCRACEMFVSNCRQSWAAAQLNVTICIRIPRR